MKNNDMKINNMKNNNIKIKHNGFKNFKHNCNRIFKSVISFVLILSLLIGYVPNIAYADTSNDYGFTWLDGKYLDKNLVVQQAAIGDSSTITLEWVCESSEPSHDLTFYTPDTVATSQYNEYTGSHLSANGAVAKHVIHIHPTVSSEAGSSGKAKIDYTHKIFIFDSDHPTASDPWIDATEAYCQILNEYDYSTKEFKNFENTEIAYSISEVDQDRGSIYTLGEQEFTFSWTKGTFNDEPHNMFRISLANLIGINSNTIYDFNLKTNSTDNTLQVIRDIGFENQPARWGIKDSDNPDSATVNKTVIAGLDKSLVRPGITMKIKSPQIYNSASHTFTAIEPTSTLASQVSVAFNIKGFNDSNDSLGQVNGITLNQLYYDNVEKKYCVDFVGYDDWTGTNSNVYGQIKIYKEGSTEKNRYIYIKKMEDSKVYNVSLVVTINDTATTINSRAYTYMDFSIDRKNINETYIKLKPYQYEGTYTAYVVQDKLDVGLFSSVYSYTDVVLGSDTGLTVVPEEIYIPIAISRDDHFENWWYTIGVRFNERDTSKKVDSEYHHYDANADINITVDVPVNARVHDVTVIRDSLTSTNKKKDSIEVAQFYISWKVPEGLFTPTGYDILNKNEKIWYEVWLNTTSFNTDPKEQYKIADIVYLERTDDGKVKITTENNNRYADLTDPDGIKNAWSEIIDSNSTEITAKILLKPIKLEDSDGTVYTTDNEILDSRNFMLISSNSNQSDDTKNHGFFSYYEPAWEGENGDITKPKSGESSKIQTYVMNKNHLYKPNSYFNTQFEKIPSDGKNYFVTLRGLYDRDINDNVLTISSFGVPVNVVLAENNEIIPIPDNINYSPNNEDKQVPILSARDKLTQYIASISGIKIDNYYKRMLEPIDANIVGDIKYEVFFASSQDKLNTVITEEKIKQQKTIKEEDTPKIDDDDDHHYLLKKLSDETNNTNIITAKSEGNYSEVCTSNPEREETTTEDSKIRMDLTKIRKGEVYSFVTANPKLIFTGLDANTNYYMALRTVINVELNDGNIETRYSEISKIYYTITSSEQILPKDNEKVPPTPTDFMVDGQTQDTKTNVKWKEPIMVLEDGYKYGYEVVRVADERLKDNQRSNSNSLEVIDSYNLKEFVGFRVVKDDNNNAFNKFYQYKKGEAGPPENFTMLSDVGQYEYLETTKDLRITDSGLKPNRIYYYYVRTIKIDNADPDEILYSEWTELTTTTIPVEGIVNLREIINPTPYKIKDFDTYYERIIAFEAPIGDGIDYGFGDVKVGEGKDLPTYIDFSISMKDSLETEYYEAKRTLECVITYDKDPTLATYVYRLQGLDSGTKYNVRVAVIDKSITDQTGNFPMSSYSNVISVRTEFNQDDYDKQNKYKEYETYYDYVLGELVNTVAFELQNDASGYSIKYKEDKMQGDIGRTKETTYSLPTTDADSFTYYISANNLKELQRTRKGLRIDHNNITVIIPYNFINDEYTKIYHDLIKDVDDMKSDVNDFYLKIWVGFNSPNGYVNGSKMTSDQVQIAMKFIEQSVMNMDIDVTIDDEIKKYIDDNRDVFFERITKDMGGEIDDALFLKYVDDEVAAVKKKMQVIASNDLAEYEMQTYQLNDLASNINFRFKTNDASSKIFTKPNNVLTWQTVNTTNSGGYSQGYVNKLGITVLASMADQSIIYGTEDKANAYYTRYKYNLDNILIRNGALDTKNDKVSQSLFKDIAFAILAIDTPNVFDLSHQKQNLDSTFVFYNDPLTRQEIVYGVLQLFNQFSQINLNQVVIDNAAQASAYNFLPFYRQSILAGYQHNIVGLSDIQNPTGYMTVDQMLDLIYRVIE